MSNKPPEMKAVCRKCDMFAQYCPCPEGKKDVYSTSPVAHQPDECRAAFENWAETKGFDTRRYDENEDPAYYIAKSTQSMWEAFCKGVVLSLMDEGAERKSVQPSSTSNTFAPSFECDISYKEWTGKRGVWPRVFMDEAFSAGWDARAMKRESVDLKYLLEELLFIVAQCNIIGSKNQDIVEIRSSANRAVQAITEIEGGKP